MLILDKFTGLISGSITQLPVPMGGTAVRCVAATVDFEISFDGSPFIPFGVAREIRPKNPDGSPYRFAGFTLKTPDNDGTANTITLVIGAADYEDTRTALFPNQTIRETPAATLTSLNYTSVSAVAPQALGGSTAQKMVNVRNTHATLSARLSTSTGTLTGGEGYILGPGENVDLPLAGSLYALSPVGTTLTVSIFGY